MHTGEAVIRLINEKFGRKPIPRLFAPEQLKPTTTSRFYVPLEIGKDGEPKEVQAKKSTADH